MDCSKCSRLVLALVILSSISEPRLVFGQESARKILDMNEPDQIDFIISTMDQGFPQDRADQMTMLIINRSALTLPLIAARLEMVLKSPSASTNFVDIASEMVAYAGDEQALRVVRKLIAIDEQRFGRLVARTLTNSTNWRNPFTLAYFAFGIGNDDVTRRTVAWSESALSSDRMRQLWAEAMLDRYGKAPGQPEWAQDPLASRMRVQHASELRDRVTSFAADALAKRQGR